MINFFVYNSLTHHPPAPCHASFSVHLFHVLLFFLPNQTNPSRLSRTRLLGAVAMLTNTLKIPFRIAPAKFLRYDMVNIHISIAKFSPTFSTYVPAVIVIISVIIFEICITIAHTQINLTLVLKCHKYPPQILKR